MNLSKLWESSEGCGEPGALQSVGLQSQILLSNCTTIPKKLLELCVYVF